MGVIQRKNLETPDELRQLELATAALASVGAHTFGRGVVQPGWRWSTHMGPTMGVSSCPIHHVQILLSGRFGVRMDDGEQMEFVANDVFDVPPGHDAWVIGDEPAVLLDVGGNIAALGVGRDHERIVTTLLMTDIVDSTKTASRLGDAAWRQVLTDHNRIVRIQLDRFGGIEVNTTGDGFLAMFPSAVGALRSANAIRSSIAEAGLQVRIGVHTGEVERIGTDIGGIAVHAAARVMALGGPSEVVVSSVTRGLAEGGGLSFREHGTCDVKGIELPIEVHLLNG